MRKKMMAGLLALLGTLIMVMQVTAGTWTSNNFIYKPDAGSRGISEKTKFDSGLNRVDTRLGNEKWLNDPAYGGDLQSAITAIGSNSTVLHIPPGACSVASDLTVPANITLKMPRGAVLNISTGKTLTLNGGVDGGLYQVFSWAGTGKVILGPGSAKEVYAEWWGAKGDGVTDCTNAIAAATNAANGNMPVVFLAGSYKVTDTLPITSWKYAWHGPRTQRGNVLSAGYHSTIIKFTPADPTKFIVSRYETSSPGEVIGPFEHKNLKFDLGNANGFEFGRESLGIGTGDTVQRSVVGVLFEKCTFSATFANRASVNGVITRSGRKMVWLTKGFECVLQDLTLQGGDTQVRTYGCDRPIFRNIRSLWSHLPLDLNGADPLSAPAVVDTFQAEGWTFTPLGSYGCGLNASNLRLEENDATPVGRGRYDLTAALGYTANVSIGGTSFTFSHDMTGILFPYLSIIELSDGTTDNTTSCLVTSVSGATVGIAAGTYIHWADATAHVTRIHGYGPIHQPGDDAADNGSYVNVAAGAAQNCPAFVYVPGRASMQIANATAEAGVDTPSLSLVIGNVVGEQYYLNQQMAFANCTPLIIAPPEHPLVYVGNWRQNYGTGGYDSNFRSKSGDLFSSFSQVQRVWTFSPKDSKNWFQMATTPVIKLAGEANTAQSLYAWLLRGSNNIWLQDKSLPTSGNIRIRIKAKAATAGGKLSFAPMGNGSGSPIATITLSTTAWTIYEVIIPCPACWQGSRDGTYGAPGFNVYPDAADIYVAAVTVEELAPGVGMPVLSAAPANPYLGLTVIADRATWDPKSKGGGGPYLVWYNGSAWKLPNEQ
jgi:hypothetical protein